MYDVFDKAELFALHAPCVRYESHLDICKERAPNGQQCEKWERNALSADCHIKRRKLSMELSFVRMIVVRIKINKQ